MIFVVMFFGYKIIKVEAAAAQWHDAPSVNGNGGTVSYAKVGQYLCNTSQTASIVPTSSNFRPYTWVFTQYAGNAIGTVYPITWNGSYWDGFDGTTHTNFGGSTSGFTWTVASGAASCAVQQKWSTVVTFDRVLSTWIGGGSGTLSPNNIFMWKHLNEQTDITATPSGGWYGTWNGGGGCTGNFTSASTCRVTANIDMGVSPTFYPIINGSCGATHNNCGVNNILGSTAEYSSEYHWWCNTPNYGTNILCVEYKNFTITFNSNGGTAVNSITQAYNSAISAPANPTRTGYTFAGWSPALATNMPVNGQSLTATWTPISYTLTLPASGGNGSGTYTGTAAGSVNYGTAASVTANPSMGSYLSSWTATGAAAGCNGGATNPCTFTMNSGASVTANYTLYTYALTIPTSGGNGAGTYGGTAAGTLSYGSKSVTATPSTGSTFTKWTASGAAAACNNAVTSPCTFVLNAPASVQAIYTLNTNTLTIPTSGGNGAGSYGGTAAGTKNYGTAISITATPSTGSTFTRWTTSGAAAACNNTTTSPCSFTMNSAASVQAIYTLNTSTLTYTAGTGGTISGTSPQTINYGANGTAVTAVANSNYYFINWSDSTTANPRTDTNIIANKSVTANFGLILNGQCGTRYDCTVGASSTPQEYPTVEYPDLYTYQWWCNTPNVGTNILCVEYKPVDVTITLTGPGTISGTYNNAGVYPVTQGSSTVITASAVPGYSVTISNGCSDSGGIGEGATCTISNISSPKTVAVVYTISTNTVTYIAGLNGSLSGTVSQSVNYGSSTTAVTAVPDTGYHFVNWTDGSTANPRTDTNIIAPTSTTANFAINSYPLIITKAGTGTGTITSGPAGINCGATCSYNFNYNTLVILTASSSANSSFSGWSGGVCSGTGTCNTTVTGTTTVTANFNDIVPPLVESPDIYYGIVSGTYFEGEIGLSSRISDSGSGIKAGSCQVSFGGNSWTSAGVDQDTLNCYYGFNTPYNPEANFSIAFRVSDNANNIGTSTTKSYMVNNAANVQGSLGVGGLVGYQNNGTISNSYSAGNVTGSHDVGGLVGYQKGGTTTNSYSTSNVSGSNFVGGLVGWQSNGTVSNTYSTGNVTASDTAGGLMGYSFGTVISSFWDKVTSGQPVSAGGDGAIGTTTAAMKNSGTFSTWSSLIWNIVASGYPTLK